MIRGMDRNRRSHERWRRPEGIESLALYGAAVPLAFVNRWISLGLYVTVAIIWLVPDTSDRARADRSTRQHRLPPTRDGRLVFTTLTISASHYVCGE